MNKIVHALSPEMVDTMLSRNWLSAPLTYRAASARGDVKLAFCRAAIAAIP